MEQAMIDALAALGVNAKECVARFGGNETLFLKFLRRFPTDPSLQTLRDAVAGGDREAVKTAAHTLKGVCGNLGIQPAFDASVRLMAVLRASEDGDYASDYQQVVSACEKAAAAIAKLG